MPDDTPPQPWQEEVAKIAADDQRAAEQAGLAADVYAHFAGLMVAGFSRPEALLLTTRYQDALVRWGTEPDNEHGS